MLIGLCSNFQDVGLFIAFGRLFGMYPFFTLGGEMKRLGYLKRLAVFLDKPFVRFVGLLWLVGSYAAHVYASSYLPHNSVLFHMVGPLSMINYMHMYSVVHSFGGNYVWYVALPLMFAVYILQVVSLLAALVRVTLPKTSTRFVRPLHL